MSLPAVAPDVVADAVATLPGRLRSKLDQAVEKQSSWTVTATAQGATVAIDSQVTVTLTAPVDVADRAVCTCLLAPRCLHRAAVLSAAPVLAAPADPPPDREPAAATSPGRPAAPAKTSPGRPAAPPGAEPPATIGVDQPNAGAASAAQPRSISADEIAATQLVRQAAAQILERGLPGAGAVTQADLLRAVHQARAVGLPRLASAGIRIVEQLRAARRTAPGFRLADLTDDLREVFTICHLLLSSGGDQAAARGTGRRGYHPVGDLRLYGLCTEPLRTATGHVGVVSYLTDAEATIWTVAQARPGDAGTARNPGNASVDLGEVTLSHRELSRAGILAANAYASADRRLSHGRAVQAVRTPGRGWHDEPAAALWRRPAAEQAGRWLTALDQSPYDRPAGHDLAFLDGVLAADRRGLLLDVAELPGPVVVLAPHDDPSLPYVANLRRLAAHATGSAVRMVGRFSGPRQVHGLAVAATWLPDRFGGHVDLGVDQLQRGDLPGAEPTAPPATDDPQPPLHLLAHHLQRVVAAGRAALIPEVAEDLRSLLDAQLPTATSVLRELRDVGQRRNRDAFGRLDQQDSSVLAAAWLTAAVYRHAAAAAATELAWGADDQLSRPSEDDGSGGR